jgi:hypothetical protein
MYIRRYLFDTKHRTCLNMINYLKHIVETMYNTILTNKFVWIYLVENTDFLQNTCQTFPHTIQHNIIIARKRKRTKNLSKVDKNTETIGCWFQTARVISKATIQSYWWLEGTSFRLQDFAESFSCTVVEGVQSAKSTQNSITFYPVFVYYR